MVHLRLSLLPAALLAGCASVPSRGVTDDAELLMFRSAAPVVATPESLPRDEAAASESGASDASDEDEHLLSYELPELGQGPTGQRPPNQRGAYPSYAGILTAYLGYRKYHDGGFWDPLDDTFSGGLEYCFRGGGSWLGFALGILGSYNSSSETISGVSRSVDAWSVEGYLGPKAYIEPAKLPLQFWGGLGLSFLYANSERNLGTTTLRDNDSTFGGYAQLGAAFRLNRRQSIGLEYRALFGTNLTLHGLGGDADYSQINLVFAVGF